MKKLLTIALLFVSLCTKAQTSNVIFISDTKQSLQIEQGDSQNSTAIVVPQGDSVET